MGLGDQTSSLTTGQPGGLLSTNSKAPTTKILGKDSWFVCCFPSRPGFCSSWSERKRHQPTSVKGASTHPPPSPALSPERVGVRQPLMNPPDWMEGVPQLYLAHPAALLLSNPHPSLTHPTSWSQGWKHCPAPGGSDETQGEVRSWFTDGRWGPAWRTHVQNSSKPMSVAFLQLPPAPALTPGEEWTSEVIFYIPTIMTQCSQTTVVKKN